MAGNLVVHFTGFDFFFGLNVITTVMFRLAINLNQVTIYMISFYLYKHK